MQVVKPETDTEKIARLQQANDYLLKANDELTKLLHQAIATVTKYDELVERSMRQTDQLLELSRRN